MDQPKETLPTGKIYITGRVANHSKFKINNVYMLPSLPAVFEVVNELENTPELMPGESKEISIEINVPAAGKYRFSPIEILYKDKDGNKYMKSSNEIAVEIK